jgi:alpha-methylacyl-CoA racemase
MSGPLAGLRVIEIAGLGPAPFCGMMLGDMGAEVIRVERKVAPDLPVSQRDPLLRNRRSIRLNLKSAAGVEVLLRLVEHCAALIEGMRPGAAERLGIGPDVCLGRNPRLVYGRMTGWGQDGPLAHAAGHDINYIALSGVLHLIGPPGGKPVPPLNLVGDFGGGGMLLLAGVLAALIEAGRSGCGQVVDAAMVDGSAALLAMFFGLRAQGLFEDATGENFLAGAAPFYDTYETADGKYVAIGSLEPAFFALLLEKLGLDPDEFGDAGLAGAADPEARQKWPRLRAALAGAFRRRTREEWRQQLEGSDVCFAPVLTLEEAARHPHNVARGTFVDVEGVMQNAPAPRFSRTPPAEPERPQPPGADTLAVLEEAGYSASDIARLRKSDAIN